MSSLLRSRFASVAGGTARRQWIRTPLASGGSLRLKPYSTGGGKESPLNADKQPGKTGVQPAYGPIGVTAALKSSPNDPAPSPTLFSREFSLADRVALVSGGNRGIGLELALALVEAGARAVYCVDLAKGPSDEWNAVQQYAKKLGSSGKTGGEGRLEYVQGNVTNQDEIWKISKAIGDTEGRLDACVAAAGVFPEQNDCLSYSAAEHRQVMDVNVNGVLFTAQAAGQQMERFGNGGSIVLIASMAGSISLQGLSAIPYNTSKSAVIQMARSMACELGPRKIRVNSLSPGYIYTNLTAAVFEQYPEVLPMWEGQNPLGRIGRPDELRGVVTWLASDASTFCTGSDIIVSGGHTAW
ncbi:sorbose reductase sou1 [Trametopsis cervina]|nr:sorbose reductase sou1 [Trametopsis cervina]